MSADLTADKVTDGWTVAQFVNNHTSPDGATWYVVYLKNREVVRVFGAGSHQESETVAAALDAVEKVNLMPGDPQARSLVLKGLKTTLNLARERAEESGTLGLYDYDLKVMLAFIVGIEKRQNPEEGAAVIPSHLS